MKKTNLKEDLVINQILVAVDGSSFSFRAARLGAQILCPNESGILIFLYVAKPQADLEWFQGHGSNLDQAPEEERQALETAFKKGQEILMEAQAGCQDLMKKGPIKVETVVVPGEPAEKIIENAEKRQCDLIVMGRRGVGRVKGALLGSVSQKVLSQSRLPVLIVK